MADSLLDCILPDSLMMTLDGDFEGMSHDSSSGAADSVSKPVDDLTSHFMITSSSAYDDKVDLLSASLQESGLLLRHGGHAWTDLENDSDALLSSILIGDSGSSYSLPAQQQQQQDLSDLEMAFSSDASIEEDGCGQSMEPDVHLSSPYVDKMDFISSGTDEDEQTLQVVNPRTNSPERKVRLNGTTRFLSARLPADTITNSFCATAGNSAGNATTTTTILPIIGPAKTLLLASKRRRISDSSCSDSGNSSITDMRTSLDELTTVPKSSCRTFKFSGLSGGRYPALNLTEEEKRICERESIKLPSHYPLTKEEERNLKRIRRKIRNKVSAQDSRRRKKEYLDNMEEQVRQCNAEKEELEKRLEQLESQNKTLAGQLRRLHQIILNGGFTSKQNQTSTALMVLLLSTALFLISDMREQPGGRKSDSSQIDIFQAIKMPPMPGQSRSLLNFVPIKQEYEDNVDTSAATTVASGTVRAANDGLLKAAGVVSAVTAGHPADASTVLVQPKIEGRNDPVVTRMVGPSYGDHDYFYTGFKVEEYVGDEVVVEGEDMSQAPFTSNNAAKEQPIRTTNGGGGKKRSYIVADVPPQGYGYIKEEHHLIADDDDDDQDNNSTIITEVLHTQITDKGDAYLVLDDDVMMAELQPSPGKHSTAAAANGFVMEERKLNISVASAQGSGVRHVVLHVPKGIQ